MIRESVSRSTNVWICRVHACG